MKEVKFMETFPPRKARSKKALYKKKKKRASLLLRLWALYLILWSTTFLTNDTYSFFTDSKSLSYTFSATSDFCANKDYANANRKECKCKGNNKAETGDGDEKSCGENGKGHEKNPQQPDLHKPLNKSNEAQEPKEQITRKAESEKEIKEFTKPEQEPAEMEKENQVANSEEQEEMEKEDES